MTFTFGQAFTFVIGIIGLLLTVLNIYDKLATIKKNANAPICNLEKRIDILEMKQAQNEARFARGDEHFDIQTMYNRMFMQIQLAFVDFELAFCQHTNYANTEDLERAKNLITEAMTNSIK